MSIDLTTDVDALLAQFAPKRLAAFPQLRPHTEFIRALRQKGASFDTIEAIMRSRGVTVSDTTIRRFCRSVLGEATESSNRAPKRKSPKRMKRPRNEPESNEQNANPPTSSSTLLTPLPEPVPSAPVLARTSLVPRERVPGPRIANVRMAQPDKP